MRHHNLQVTGSVVVNGLGVATATELTSYTASADAKISTLQSFTSSTSGRLNAIETITASNIARINSIETITSSNVARLNALEAKTGSLATTGSNTFIGTQTITGSLYISSDLIVQGSSSLQNITASAVSIGTNLINLNTANPAIRYAGLSIGDSGSIGGSGSFLYDSVQDEMIFVHRGANTTVTSSVVLMGPQTFDNIGSETYPTLNIVQKGTDNEHLVDSCIFDNGTTTCVKNNFVSTGTGLFSGQLCSITGVFGSKGGGNYGVLISDNDQSNVRLRFTNSGTGGQSMSIVGGNPAVSNSGLAFYDETNTCTRMYISSNGNVGIGTTLPGLNLSAQGLYGLPNTSGTQTVGIFRVQDSVSNIALDMGVVQNVATWIQSGNKANSAVLPLILNPSGGSVGIGTDTPTTHASVSGLVVKGIGARGIIEVWDGTCGKGVFQQVGGTTYIGNLDKGTSGGSLRLLVNGSGGSATEAMVINCLGRVLINNTTAVGTGADYSRVTISGTCNKNQIPGVGGSILHLTSCENDYPFGIKFNIVGDTCNCLRSVQIQTGDHGLTNQGNVTFQHAGGGILMGTSTSSGIGILNTYKAPVSSNYVDQIVVQSTGNYPSLRLGTYDAYDAVIATTGNDLRILSGLNVYTENHDIMFYTSFNGGTGGAQCYERMRIRYDGNVGIGSTAPSAKLQVAGTIYNSATAGGSNYTLDTMGAYQSIANNGFVDFNAMSGFLMVNNWTNGATTLFVMGGGNTGVVGTITGTAGTTHHNPGVGGYRWCNNYGSTANFGFQVFRTRNTA